MTTITLSPQTQTTTSPPPPIASMLTFEHPYAGIASSNPYAPNHSFAHTYGSSHVYSDLVNYSDSDYEPLIPARNPLRDPAYRAPSTPSSSSSEGLSLPEATPTSTGFITIAKNANQASPQTPPASPPEVKGKRTTTPSNFRTARHTNLFTNPPPPPHLNHVLNSPDAIIPAIIVNVIPAASHSAALPTSTSPSTKPASFLRRLSLKGESRKTESEKGVLKVVYMPRTEYKKYFARGLNGEYVGTEPYRRWAEEELEERFGRYKPMGVLGLGGR